MLLRVILLIALVISLAGCAGLNEDEKTQCHKSSPRGKGGQTMVPHPC